VGGRSSGTLRARSLTNDVDAVPDEEMFTLIEKELGSA